MSLKRAFKTKIVLKITTDELAVVAKVSSKTIKRHISKLPNVKYVGSGYSGHWEILD